MKYYLRYGEKTKVVSRKEVLDNLREFCDDYSEELLKDLDEGKLDFIPLYDCWVEKNDEI